MATSDSIDNTETYNKILNKSNIILLLWFLAIYFIVYFILKIYFNKSDTIQNSNLRLSQILDISIFLVVIVYLGFAYQSTSNQQAEQNISTFLTKVKNYFNDPTSIFSVLLFILTFYLVIYFVSIPMSPDTKPITITIIENIALFVFVILLIIDFFKYFLNVNLTNTIVSDSVVNYWAKLPSKYVSSSDSSGNKVKAASVDSSGNKVVKEVFNISNNMYTYEDAQAVCSSYNAELATYTQIEQSYHGGGEWCNYGWSDNQMIFFPTQKSTWDKLQKNPKTKNNCGRPGINGGYMANPNLKFGVNCYGVKPKPSTYESKLMNAKVNDVIPKTPEQQLVDDKVKLWKENNMLVVNSFNKDKWSEY